MRKNIIFLIIAMSLLVASIAEARAWPVFHNGNVLIKNGYIRSSNGFQAGSGSRLTRLFNLVVTNVTTGSIPSNSASGLVILDIPGVLTTDTIIVSPVAVASGIETTDLGWSAYIPEADKVTITAVNPTGSGIDILNTQSWKVTVFREE